MREKLSAISKQPWAELRGTILTPRGGYEDGRRRLKVVVNREAIRPERVNGSDECRVMSNEGKAVAKLAASKRLQVREAQAHSTQGGEKKVSSATREQEDLCRTGTRLKTVGAGKQRRTYEYVGARRDEL
jgi:hypothetical protein